MILLLETITIFFLFSSLSAQTKNSIGVSVPVIWNLSIGPHRNISRQNQITGSAISYGIIINYVRNITRNLYVGTAFGYFKQSFAVKRPADFTTTVGSLQLFASKYNYDCTQASIEAGFQKEVSQKTFSIGSAFNQFYTFRQNYITRTLVEKTHLTMALGYRIDINCSLEKKVNNRFSIAAKCILPVIAKWRNDPMFYDEKIAKQIVSAGISLTTKYHF